MHLDPLYIQVLPRLTNTGSSEYAQGVLPLTNIDIGYRHFTVAEGISYDVSLLNTSEAILLSGTATASITADCDRCLETTELHLSGEVQGYYLFDPEETPGEEQLEIYESVDTRGRVDIAPPVLAAIVFELPSVTLCRPDCEGIPLQGSESPDADGKDKEDAGLEADGIRPESPFAALKDFKFEE